MPWSNAKYSLGVQIEEIRHSKEVPERKTIFHEVLQAKIPDSEKTTARLSSESMTIVVAGMESTSSTLAALTYHLLANPPILKRLKAELSGIMQDPNELPSAVVLDGLPYLVSLPCFPRDKDADCETERCHSGKYQGISSGFISPRSRGP